MVRLVNLKDAALVCDIYNYYILNSISTFELEELSVNEISERINRVMEKYPWVVYEEEGIILGYAYADQWKNRKAYAHTVESAVYVRDGYYKSGIGRQLYTFLINELKNINMHAVIAGISLPNDASITLHEKLGFENIARFKQVGYKFERWIDVGYWELILRQE